MQILNSVLSLLAWVTIAIVLYAIWPFLMKLLAAAQHLHNLGM